MTETSEMVERVARALCRTNGGAPDAPDPFDRSGKLLVWMAYRDEARAAIQAMREPSDQMVSGWFEKSPAYLRSVWHAMIDAALSPGAEGK